VALVVQKYGGSSVQDADRIKKVAERIVRTHKEGHDVVVVVAAANTSSVCQQNSPEALTTISSPGWFDDDVLTVAATDGNGKPDLFQFDTDGDGKVDITMVDLNEDGNPDMIVDGDGGLPPTT